MRPLSRIQQRIDAVIQCQRIALQRVFAMGRKIKADHGCTEDAHLLGQRRQHMGILSGTKTVNTQNAAAGRTEIRLIDFTRDPQRSLGKHKIPFHINSLSSELDL